MRKYTGKNRMPFASVCGNNFGRQVIYTKYDTVDASNIVDELNKALSIHRENAMEIEYLDNYYRGDQPILYRIKKNRPDVNNKVVVNIAQFIVDSNASALLSEPVQYVLKETNEKKAKDLRFLNQSLDDCDKNYSDIELCRWRSICGTAYRFVGTVSEAHRVGEELFSLQYVDPRKCFVAYYEDNTPAFGCQIRKDVDGKFMYWVYTRSLWFVIQDNEIKQSGINGNGAIPLVEYPNNARRLSDIEITIALTDEINKLTSDRANGTEQFVQSWVKFINCEIDIEKFREVREEGFFSVTTTNGSENKSDVDIMSQELDQTQSQIEMDDLFNKLLIIQGIANREGNTGGDTGSAVSLRNGHSASLQKTKFNEPIFKRAERQMIRLVLNQLRIKSGTTLTAKDIEIKIPHSKNDNMLTKAEVLKMLLECGVQEDIAIKTVDLFSDPEQVAFESKERIRKIYAKEDANYVEENQTVNNLEKMNNETEQKSEVAKNESSTEE